MDQLTLDSNWESVTCWRGNSIARHTQVITHVETADFLQSELSSFNDIYFLALNHYIIAILSSPNDMRRRISIGITGKSNILPFSHYHVTWPTLDDLWRNWNKKQWPFNLKQNMTYLQPPGILTDVPLDLCLFDTCTSLCRSPARYSCGDTTCFHQA